MRDYLVVVLLKLFYIAIEIFLLLQINGSKLTNICRINFCQFDTQLKFRRVHFADKAFPRSDTDSAKYFPGFTCYYNFLLLLLSLPLLFLNVTFYLLILLDKRSLQAIYGLYDVSGCSYYNR